jgi:hypothetical protein
MVGFYQIFNERSEYPKICAMCAALEELNVEGLL